jgi:hypothetical protein
MPLQKISIRDNPLSMGSPSSSNTYPSKYYKEIKQKAVEEIQNAKNEISTISRLFGSVRLHDVNSFNKVYK